MRKDRLIIHSEAPDYTKRKYRSKILDGLRDCDYLLLVSTIDGYVAYGHSLDDSIYKACYALAKQRGLLEGIGVVDIMRQRQLSTDMKYWEEQEDGTFWFKSKCAKDWRYVNPLVINPVSNLESNGVPFQYLYFEDISGFIQSSLDFDNRRKNGGRGYYVKAARLSDRHFKFWSNEHKKNLYGMTYEGVRVTNRLYFYLNYGRLKSSVIDRITGEELDTRKRYNFPRFLDHIYYLALEIENITGEVPFKDNKEEYDNFFNIDDYSKLPYEENRIKVFGKQVMSALVLVKARRAGMTFFLSTGLLVYNYTFLKESNNILVAQFESKYTNARRAVSITRSHLNANTEFKQERHVLNQADHFRASILINKEEHGSMSECHFYPTAGDPQKVVGDSADVVIYEESGAHKHLKHVQASTSPLLFDGSKRIGVEAMIGTGGDMSDGTLDFASIYYNPRARKFKAYANLHEPKQDCGLFYDAMWYRYGNFLEDQMHNNNDAYDPNYAYPMVDRQGNSWRELSQMSINYNRIYVPKGESAVDIISQYPKLQSEAFLKKGTDMFDSGDLIPIRDKLISDIADGIVTFDVVEFRYNKKNEKIMLVKLEKELFPLEFPLTDNNNTKVVTAIFEHPIQDKESQHRRYLMFIDSYDYEKSSKKEGSLGCAKVFDRLTRRIVAELIGREDPDIFSYQCMGLSMYYNATTGYDSGTTGMDTYYIRNGNRALLAPEPSFIRSQLSPNTKNVRDYGVPMTTGVQLFARKELKTYLKSIDDLDPDLRRYREHYRSPAALSELSGYNTDDNFDRVTVDMGLMVLDYEYRMQDVIEMTGEDLISFYKSNAFENLDDESEANEELMNMYYTNTKKRTKNDFNDY